MRRDARTQNGRVRLEWLPPLRRMTRCARELERHLARSPSGAEGAEAIRQCALGGVAEWQSARELVKLSQHPLPLLDDGRGRLSEDELTDVLLDFADDLETRVRLVRSWAAASSPAASATGPVEWATLSD